MVWKVSYDTETKVALMAEAHMTEEVLKKAYRTVKGAKTLVWWCHDDGQKLFIERVGRSEWVLLLMKGDEVLYRSTSLEIRKEYGRLYIDYPAHVRVAIFAERVIPQERRQDILIKMMETPIGSRKEIYASSPVQDDVRILAERVATNRFILVKKTYSVVTFTSESHEFKVEAV